MATLSDDIGNSLQRHGARLLERLIAAAVRKATKELAEQHEIAQELAALTKRETDGSHWEARRFQSPETARSVKADMEKLGLEARVKGPFLLHHDYDRTLVKTLAKSRDLSMVKFTADEVGIRIDTPSEVRKAAIDLQTKDGRGRTVIELDDGVGGSLARLRTAPFVDMLAHLGIEAVGVGAHVIVPKDQVNEAIQKLAEVLKKDPKELNIGFTEARDDVSDGVRTPSRNPDGPATEAQKELVDKLIEEGEIDPAALEALGENPTWVQMHDLINTTDLRRHFSGVDDRDDEARDDAEDEHDDADERDGDGRDDAVDDRDDADDKDTSPHDGEDRDDPVRTASKEAPETKKPRAPEVLNPDIAARQLEAQRSRDLGGVENRTQHVQSRPPAGDTDPSTPYADGADAPGSGDKDGNGVMDSAEDRDGDGVVDSHEAAAPRPGDLDELEADAKTASEAHNRSASAPEKSVSLQQEVR